MDQLNHLKDRAWNYYLLYTPTHVIELIFADLTVTSSSSMTIFEKDNIENSIMKAKETTRPTFDKDKLIAESSVKGDKLNMDI